MHLHCSETQILSIFSIICSKVCIAINPGRVPPGWIICWWRHERSNIAGDEMPVSAVRAGEVSLGRCVWWDSSAGQTWFPWGCSGACTDGAHGDVWREGRLKPPVFFLCPLQGLRRIHSDGGFPKRLTCWRSRSVHLEMACVHGK